MANQKYSLKYRTFDQLFEDVAMDLSNYKIEGLIRPETLIKIARKCNYDLGCRIYRTRHAILELDRGKVRLPNDFHLLNVAFVCGTVTYTEHLPQGTHVEERLIGQEYTPDPGYPDLCPTDDVETCVTSCSQQGTIYVNDCGEEYQLVQKIQSRVATYDYFHPLYITPHEKIQTDCPNTKLNRAGTAYEARIENGWLITNLDDAKVYVNYTASMVDEEGNLLVPDHEMLNEYYEYALKKKILENLTLNGEPAGEKFKLIKQELREARNYALTIVNTPDFQEIQKIHQINRRAQYHKFYNMFRS